MAPRPNSTFVELRERWLSLQAGPRHVERAAAYREMAACAPPASPDTESAAKQSVDPLWEE